MPLIGHMFPSSLLPLFQNESKCETFHMKMSSASSFIFMQIKFIFICWMVSHLDSLWNRGTRELGNGLIWHHCPFPEKGRSLHKFYQAWLPVVSLTVCQSTDHTASVQVNVFRYALSLRQSGSQISAPLNIMISCRPFLCYFLSVI